MATPAVQLRDRLLGGETADVLAKRHATLRAVIAAGLAAVALVVQALRTEDMTVSALVHMAVGHTEANRAFEMVHRHLLLGSATATFLR